MRRSLPAVSWLLRRLGYSSLRPRPRHCKAAPEEIEAFKREWPKRIKKIAEQHPGKRLRVYFQDESRFGQQRTNTNVWAEKGSRPTAVRQTEYEYLWVIEAACPETGHGLARVWTRRSSTRSWSCSPRRSPKASTW